LKFASEGAAAATLVALLGFVTVLSGPVQAQLCSQWADAVRIGELPSQVRESSGIAASRVYPDRLYHINDSGDAGRFFISRLDGSQLQAVAVAGFRPSDTEAMGLGPCPGPPRRSCIYIGDIGDNRARRNAIEVVAVEEQARFTAAAKPVARLLLRYPDGPHNAESMAVHPDGTLFILTKNRPARLYKVRVDSAPPVLEAVATLDAGNTPTDMTISDDGSRLLVLTYKEAVEFRMDFKEQRRIPLLALPQQESVTFLPGSRSFIFATERAILLQPQPIMKVNCR
jgi:hypothetical protein